MRKRPMPPRLAALLGAALVLPFVTANWIVGNRIEPFFSVIRPGLHTSTREYLMLFVVLILILAGAFIAARPLFQRTADGSRRFYPLNAILAVVLCAIFLALSVGLGSDIYRCDVLQIPNCD